MEFSYIADFLYLAALYGIGVSLIILLFPRGNTYNNRLLGISLFAYAWFLFSVALMSSHVMLKVPHLFRSATPLMYLIAPTGYLYVRSTLSGETRPQKYDWIHFIPFVVLLLELIPFYMKDSSTKIILINYYVRHMDEVIYLREGMIEGHIHFILRAILTLVYAYLQRNLILNFMFAASSKVLKQYEKLTNWLKLYTLLISITFCLVLLVNIVNLCFKVFTIVPDVIMSIHLIITSFILIFMPHVLYNFNPNAVAANAVIERAPGIEATEKMAERKIAIDELLQFGQKYLIKGYSAQHNISSY